MKPEEILSTLGYSVSMKKDISGTLWPKDFLKGACPDLASVLGPEVLVFKTGYENYNYAQSERKEMASRTSGWTRAVSIKLTAPSSLKPLRPCFAGTAR